MVNYIGDNNIRRTSNVASDHLYKVTGLVNIQTEDDIKKPSPEFDVEKEIQANNEPADFETAIAATGYGKFHIVLLLAAMPAYWSTIYVSTTISYTLSGAECDLGISLMDKGLLNSITYTGMMVSGVVWGYLSDTLGRKKIMVIGFISLAFVEFVGSMSQSFSMLLVAKFFAGFVFNGPFAVIITYLAEMHSTAMRAKILLFSGIFFSMGALTLPMIAWAVIPNEWDFYFFDGAFGIHSWNIFLAIFSVPPLISGLALATVPESPKFLMSRGRNEEALKIFQTIYSKNSGQPPETYPIKSLVQEINYKNENDVRKSKGIAAVVGGFKQMAPFFSKPYLSWSLLLCALSVAAMFGENSLRLWFPQISGILEDYNLKHSDAAGLCGMIAPQTVSISKDVDEQSLIKECVKISVGASTYVSSIIIGCSTSVLYIFAGLYVNKIGKKRLLVILYSIAAIFPLALPWTNTIPEVVAIFSTYLSFTGACGTTISSVIVDLYPTQLRAMAVAVIMLCGRIGTIIGNLVFPALLQTGCYPPFLVIAAVVAACAFGCSFLPVTTLKKME